MSHAMKILSALSVVIMLSSCATKALWKATAPESYVRVRSDVVLEEDIRKKGLKYYRSDTEKALYVEKNDLHKLRDYTLRLFGTPITVAIDAVTSILVVGAIVVAADVEHKSEDQCDQDPACWQHRQNGSSSR